MDLKSDTSTVIGFGAAVATTNGMPQLDSQCALSHIQSYSQSSGVSIPSENSAPNFVYQRRRPLKSPAPLPLTRAPAKTSSNVVNFVYERRQRQRSNVSSISTIVSAHASPYGACTSAIRSHIPSVAAVGRTGCSHEAVNNLLPSTTSEKVNGRLVVAHGSDVKDKTNKIIELHSVDDSCSSSALDMDIGSVPGETKIDDTDECSSSDVLVADVLGDNQSLSTKDLCISILRSQGLLFGFGSNRSNTVEEDILSCSSSSSRSCNRCGRSETADKMLICDECEEAFHISCCNSSARKMPVDDWYCQSCFKKKHISMKEKAFRKSSIFYEKGSASSEGDMSPIALMLKDSEPYTTRVRVGKGFQAIVPEWAGPITEDTDIVPEPIELEPSNYVNLPGLVSGKRRRSNFIGNWVQCREVIVGIGEGFDGAVCGKWRRAPLFEVQTDNWNCFCSVLWDPCHADCAVPQELETEEILKQLKYVEMLRPQLAARRRRLDVCNAHGFLVHTEDAKCIGSTNASKGFVVCSL